MNVSYGDVTWRMTVELVTPELAADWLKFNIENRPEKDPAQARYTVTMNRKEWLYPAPPIVFSKRRLIDGQNRLHAVIRSGVSVPMVVWWDIPDENFRVWDRGVSRSTADALGLSKKLVEVAKMVLDINSNAAHDGSVTDPRVGEICRALAQDHSDLTDGHKHGTKTFSSVPFRTAALIRMFGASHEQRDEVIAIYKHLIKGEVNKVPPYAQNLVAYSSRAEFTGLQRSDRVAVSCIAWRAFTWKSKGQDKVHMATVSTSHAEMRKTTAVICD